MIPHRTSFTELNSTYYLKNIIVITMRMLLYFYLLEESCSLYILYVYYRYLLYYTISFFNNKVTKEMYLSEFRIMENYFSRTKDFLSSCNHRKSKYRLMSHSLLKKKKKNGKKAKGIVAQSLSKWQMVKILHLPYHIRVSSNSTQLKATKRIHPNPITAKLSSLSK